MPKVDITAQLSLNYPPGEEFHDALDRPITLSVVSSEDQSPVCVDWGPHIPANTFLLIVFGHPELEYPKEVQVFIDTLRIGETAKITNVDLPDEAAEALAQQLK